VVVIVIFVVKKKQSKEFRPYTTFEDNSAAY